MADITPTDIVNKEFRRSLRGYATDEVEEFLQQTSDSLFHVLEENQRLRAQIDSLTEQVKRYQQTEELIKNALVLAERTADEVRSHAVHEADQLRHEAEEQVRAARSELENMRQARLRIVAEMRALLTTHLSMLDAQDTRPATGQASTGEGEYR